MCPSHSDHVSLFIGLHLQAPSDKDSPPSWYTPNKLPLLWEYICVYLACILDNLCQKEPVNVPSVKEACLVSTMRAEHF